MQINNDNVVVDGFTFASGNGRYNYQSTIQGNGITIFASKIKIENCTFINHCDGSPIYMGYGHDVKLNKCNFINNYRCSAISTDHDTCSILNCFFYGNNGWGTSVSCIHFYFNSVCDVINCIFESNGTRYISGIFNDITNLIAIWRSQVNFYNSTFINNIIESIYPLGVSVISGNATSNVKIYNTIMNDSTNELSMYSSNCNIKSSNIQGSGGSAHWLSRYGSNDGGNIDVDPLLTVDYYLQPNSPCIDMADDKYAPVLDKDGNYRIDIPNVGRQGTKSDMGAYEYRP